MGRAQFYCTSPLPRHGDPLGSLASTSGDLDSDLRIVGVRERICVMEKAAHSHTTSSKLFTLRVDRGGGGRREETRVRHL